MIENKTARELAIGLAMVEVCKHQIKDVRELADEVNGMDDRDDLKEWSDDMGFAIRMVHSCLSHEIYHALLGALVHEIGYAEGE